jgi:cytochrome c553
MPKHIVRLLLLLVAAGVVALGAIKFLTVDSFYQYGHYRGNSVAELASDKPNYKGVAYCQSCHAERVTQWSKGAHNRADAGKIVMCEVCHGAAADRHPRGVIAAAATGVEHPKNLKMTVPTDTRQLCALCHERTAGRPAQQPQIVVADHAGTQQCSVCHNPHSPKLAAATPATARAGNANAEAGKAKAAACAGCHGADGVSVNLPGPTLAGQNEAYFIEAMKAYGTGARNNPMMSPAAQGLSNEDIENLAAYYAARKCESTLTADKQAASPGRATASKCIACHGADGVTSNRAWPNLVGLSKEHLLETLKAYKSDTRKNAMMAGILKDMSDAEAENVAAYYANATCK